MENKIPVSWKKKRYSSIEKRHGFYGRMFLLPWCIGFTIFFFIPLLQSIWYSFSVANPLDDVPTDLIGYLKDNFVGFQRYIYIWNEQPDFTSNLLSSVTSYLYSMPIIIILSLVFALVLNQKFHGRLIARAIFFLPVIIATGAVLSILSSDATAKELLENGQSSANMYKSLSFSDMMMNMGIASQITRQLDVYISSIFDLVWNSGIETLLFLAGLQAIPQSLYEVAHVEGATPWESFWFITMPMMFNVLLLNIVFVSIELFTAESNIVMKQAYNLIQQSNYNVSSAIIWSYCLVMGLIIAVLALLVSRLFKKYMV